MTSKIIKSVAGIIFGINFIFVSLAIGESLNDTLVSLEESGQIFAIMGTVMALSLVMFLALIGGYLFTVSIIDLFLLAKSNGENDAE